MSSKNESEITLELYDPHKFQKQVHKACSEGEEFRVITVCAGRQSGKTQLAINQVFLWAFKKRNTVIGFVSPSDGQSIKIQNEMIKLLQNSGLILNYVRGISNRKIKFIYGSEIRFFSAKSNDSIRGQTLQYLVIDEAAFVQQEVFENILFPTLAVAGKRLLITSTPKGKNYFYLLFTKGKNDEYKNYYSFKFTSADNPRANLEIIEEARKNNSEAYFRQEFLAEFIDKSGVFQNIDYAAILDRQQPMTGFKYFFGVDIGMKNDSTVISIFDNFGNLCDYIRLTKVEAHQIKNKIIELNLKWNPKKIYLEQNGIGNPILSDLKTIHKLNNIEGFNTDNRKKEEIINNLVYALNNGECLLLNDSLLKHEFKSFVVSYTKNGNPQFFADSGHDDIVMSTAIAYNCYQKNRTIGSYSVM